RTLKYCGSGGAPLPLEVAQQFASITGCNLSEGWGMTETSPSGTYVLPLSTSRNLMTMPGIGMPQEPALRIDPVCAGVKVP
ncbi:AMP-binding protein, partial [Bradyrhizobium uaiense]